MDVGHGQGSFNWTVAKIATDEGFWPDILSTDIHRDSRHGPCYDLPTVITKWLMVGMPLVECIAKTTCRPAEAIGWGDRIGTLGVGRVADIACFEMVDVNVMLEDCQSQLRRFSSPECSSRAMRGSYNMAQASPLMGPTWLMYK